MGRGVHLCYSHHFIFLLFLPTITASITALSFKEPIIFLQNTFQYFTGIFCSLVKSIIMVITCIYVTKIEDSQRIMFPVIIISSYKISCTEPFIIASYTPRIHCSLQKCFNFLQVNIRNPVYPSYCYVISLKYNM